MLKRLWNKWWKTPDPEWRSYNWRPQLLRVTGELEQALAREARLKDDVKDLTFKGGHSLRNHAYIVQVTNCMNRMVAANIDWFTVDQQHAMLASMNAALDAIDHAETRRSVENGTFKE